MAQYDTPQEQLPPEAQGGQLAPTQPPQQQLATATQEMDEAGMLAKWERAEANFASSFDVTTPEGGALFWKALQKGDSQLNMRVNEELLITDWFMHFVELHNDETGEIKKSPRLVLVLTNGATVSTTSPIFAKAFAYAMKLNGRGPWSPPLAIRAKKAQGNGTRTYLAMDYAKRAAEEAPPTNGGKKAPK